MFSYFPGHHFGKLIRGSFKGFALDFASVFELSDMLGTMMVIYGLNTEARVSSFLALISQKYFILDHEVCYLSEMKRGLGLATNFVCLLLS